MVWKLQGFAAYAVLVNVEFWVQKMRAGCFVLFRGASIVRDTFVPADRECACSLFRGSALLYRARLPVQFPVSTLLSSTTITEHDLKWLVRTWRTNCIFSILPLVSWSGARYLSEFSFILLHPSCIATACRIPLELNQNVHKQIHDAQHTCLHYSNTIPF